jgi:predicted nucleic acid-binding Zn ribbon protein
MPLYTFRCGRCGAVIHITHGFQEPHPKVHKAWIAKAEFTATNVWEIEDSLPGGLAAGSIPIGYEPCNGELVRVWDVPNIIYVGSGFYTTDKVLYDHPTEMDIEDGSYDPYAP